MGLIGRAKRVWYIGSWRIRYWWLDTRDGLITSVCLCVLLALASLVSMIKGIIDFVAPPPGQPLQAIAPWLVYLIIAAIAAALSFALAPKPKAPPPAQGNAPSVEDGQAVIDCFGDCWIDEEFLLAWKVVGRQKIKSKGGKK